MFTTVEQVKELTGRDVTLDTIGMAQSIIEVYVGRLEVEVVSPTDGALLGKATAYQAAYMHDDEEKVFEQISASQIAQHGNVITFKANDNVSPWIAPLAVLACKRLSWNRIRSVKTGSIFRPALPEPGWETE